MKFLGLMGLLLVSAVIVALARLALQDTAGGELEERTRVPPRLVAEDSSGNGHHGIIQGNPTLGLPGHSGAAYSFDQPGSWVQVPSHPQLNPQHRDFVVSAWVMFSDAPTRRETYDIVRKGLTHTVSGEFKIEIVRGGRVRCSAKDSTRTAAAVLGPESNLADGKWHQIGCARTGSAWSVIVDRAIVTEKAALGSIGNTLPMSIGSNYGVEDLPPGLVDEVSLFMATSAPEGESRPSAQTPDQIRLLRSGKPVGLWNLDETASVR